MEEGFKPTIRAIKKWDREVRKELRSELKGAGEMIASDARQRADAVSKTAGKTIKVRTGITSRQVEVKVLAGSPDVPIAGLLELGNKGGRSKGKFRHPVFGDRGNWQDQPMHPYVAPAVAHREGDVKKRVEAAVARSIDTVKL
jgi:hypothetical protein